VQRKRPVWGGLVRADFGRLGLRRPGRRHEGPAVASAVRPRTLVAFLVLGMLFIAASWVDTGTAASPDPHPSAEQPKAPAPDTYDPPASEPSTPSAPEQVTETVTQPVIQVETTPSTRPSTGTVHRTTAKPATDTASGARTQKKPAKEPEKTVAPSRPRHEPARLVVGTPSDDGGPLLLGGIGMALLAIASGSLLLFLVRAGNTGGGRLETRT
jgi:hypothetical protein